MTKLACLETIKRRRKGLSPLTIVKRPPPIIFNEDNDFFTQKNSLHPFKKQDLEKEFPINTNIFWLLYIFLLAMVVKYF